MLTGSRAVNVSPGTTEEGGRGATLSWKAGRVQVGVFASFTREESLAPRIDLKNVQRGCPCALLEEGSAGELHNWNLDTGGAHRGWETIFSLTHMIVGKPLSGLKTRSFTRSSSSPVVFGFCFSGGGGGCSHGCREQCRRRSVPLVSVDSMYESVFAGGLAGSPM